MKTSGLATTFSVWVALLGGCGSTGTPAQNSPSPQPTVHLQSAMKEYTSVDELGRDSAVAVSGTLERVIGHAEDNGGLDGSAGAIPMTLYSFQVRDQTAGAALPSSIKIAYIDTDRVVDQHADPLAVGANYVFFLEARTRRNAPALKAWAPFYVPTGGNGGVFELRADGTAIARASALRSVSAGGVKAQRINERMKVPVSTLLGTRTRGN